MRKEILLAIIVGIIVGLGLTFGLYLIRQRLDDSSTVRTIEESRQGNGDEAADEESNQSLVLQKPEPDLFVSEVDLQVVGRAIPQSYIVILVGTNEFITTADADGDFAQTVQLVAGGNRLTVIATSPDGVQESVVRSVVFSAANLDAPASASATPSATPRATLKPTPTPGS